MLKELKVQIIRSQPTSILKGYFSKDSLKIIINFNCGGRESAVIQLGCGMRVGEGVGGGAGWGGVYWISIIMFSCSCSVLDLHVVVNQLFNIKSIAMLALIVQMKYMTLMVNPIWQYVLLVVDDMINTEIPIKRPTCKISTNKLSHTWCY